MLYTAMLCLFIVLNLADAYVTVKGIEGSDRIKEKNPLAKKLMDLFGLRAGAYGLKIVGLTLFVIFSYDTPAWIYFFLFFNAYYAWLVWNNIQVLKRNGVEL